MFQISKCAFNIILSKKCFKKEKYRKGEQQQQQKTKQKALKPLFSHYVKAIVLQVSYILYTYPVFVLKNL